MSNLAEPQLNATPLIDVLLVLLVMIIFTLPVATHTVKLNLPQAVTGTLSSFARTTVIVDIDFDGQLYWNGTSLQRAELEGKLRDVAAALRPPHVKVVPDKRVRYENVAQVLAAAQRLGVSKLEVAPSF